MDEVLRDEREIQLILIRTLEQEKCVLLRKQNKHTEKIQLLERRLDEIQAEKMWIENLPEDFIDLERMRSEFIELLDLRSCSARMYDWYEESIQEVLREQEQIEELLKNLETDDDSLPLITSEAEPHNSLNESEICLPSIELKIDISKMLDPILDDMPNKKKSGSFDSFGSSFYNCDNEYYTIEFEKLIYVILFFRLTTERLKQ